MSSTTSVVTINNLPDELLELISISAGPTEYCNFRRAMKRVWLTTTGREDHCVKYFLVTEVTYYSGTRVTLCGNLHSMFDWPAWIGSNGTKNWYQHGKQHRDNDQPARVTTNGKQDWYQHGKLHRDNDQPAIIFAGGSKAWFQHGKCHRDNDLPAIIHSNGTKTWYKYNKRYTP